MHNLASWVNSLTPAQLKAELAKAIAENAMHH